MLTGSRLRGQKMANENQLDQWQALANAAANKFDAKPQGEIELPLGADVELQEAHGTNFLDEEYVLRLDKGEHLTANFLKHAARV